MTMLILVTLILHIIISIITIYLVSGRGSQRRILRRIHFKVFMPNLVSLGFGITQIAALIETHNCLNRVDY